MSSWDLQSLPSFWNLIFNKEVRDLEVSNLAVCFVHCFLEVLPASTFWGNNICGGIFLGSSCAPSPCAWGMMLLRCFLLSTFPSVYIFSRRFEMLWDALWWFEMISDLSFIFDMFGIVKRLQLWCCFVKARWIKVGFPGLFVCNDVVWCSVTFFLCNHAHSSSLRSRHQHLLQRAMYQRRQWYSQSSLVCVCLCNCLTAFHFLILGNNMKQVCFQHVVTCCNMLSKNIETGNLTKYVLVQLNMICFFAPEFAFIVEFNLQQRGQRSWGL